MTTRTGSIVALPYTLELGDIPVFLQHGGSGEDFERMIIDQFNTMYEEGHIQPRVLSIALHPFLIGHPFRARYSSARWRISACATQSGSRPAAGSPTGSSQSRCHK
jgi:hypothetical protein